MGRPARGGGGLGRQVAADVRDQRKQICAVDGGVCEPAAFPVPVAVQAPAAAANHRAFLARLAEPGYPLLTGDHTGMLTHKVKGMVKHIHPGFRGTVERYLQRINLLIGSVGLNDRETHGPESESLRKALAAMQSRDNRVEGPDLNRAAFREPAVEDYSQPISILSFRGPGTEWWAIPGGVGQEEINTRRLQIF